MKKVHLSIYVSEADASFFWKLSKENGVALITTILGLIDQNISGQLKAVENKRRLALKVLNARL